MSDSSPKRTRGTKREALRALLADGQWHHMRELRDAGGWRYGARMLELRRGVGGPVLKTQKRSVGPDEFEYRAVFSDQAELALAPKSRRASQKERLAELTRENAALKARLAQLEGGAHVG